MPTYPTSPRSDFFEWCQSHVDTFVSHASTIGLTTAQATAFKTAVINAIDADASQVAAKEAAKAATTTANTAVSALRRSAADTVRLIKAFAESTNNPAVYATAQIPPPATPSPLPPPGKPTDMNVAIAPATGAITLKFKCTNPAGAAGTAYIIRRRVGSSGPFEFVGVTGKKSFTDSTFIAGPDTVSYTVQAQRSDSAGPISDILVINFGAQNTVPPGARTSGVNNDLKMAA